MTEFPSQRPPGDDLEGIRPAAGEPPPPGVESGASRPGEPPGEAEGDHETAFTRILADLTPRLFVTPALVVINVAVFALMAGSGVHPLNPGIEDLIGWGANYGPKTTQGEWWRLWTCTYIHIGLLHLLFNVWVLWEVGELVERLFGNPGFFVLYTFSGLLGSLASVLWNPLLVSAGASGAIFGVYGALLAVLLRHQGSIPAATLTRLKNSTVAFVAYNLLFGLTMERIDVAAHIGGLLGGLVCGLVLSHPLTPAGAARRSVRNLWVGVGGSLLLGAAVLLPSEGIPDPREVINQMAATEEKALRTYNTALQRREKMEISEKEFADIIARDVLPDWRTGRAQMDRLDRLRGVKQEMVALYRQYLAARQESWELLLAAIREGNDAKGAQAQAKWAEAERLAGEIETEAANMRKADLVPPF